MEWSWVVDKIRTIVDKVHTNPLKKNVNEYHDRINFACPVCGDSEKNPRNYRGNLNKLLYYKCFNCGHQSHFSELCNRYDIHIDSIKKKEIYDFIDSQITSFNDVQKSFMNYGLKYDIHINDLIDNLYDAPNCPLFGLKPIEKDSSQYHYLQSRKIPSNAQILQGQYLHKPGWEEEVIVLVNAKRDGSSLLGLQVRNLQSDKRKRLFKVYNFEQCWNWTHPDKELPVEEAILYNRLSSYFNILNINFNDTITIFEGYIDSLFFPNSIGVVGTNTDFSFLENNGLDIRYFFDHDAAGWKKSIEKIGYFPVFLWNKFLDALAEKKNPYDYYQWKERVSKIKDMNEVAKYFNNPYQELSMTKYFSVDKYDKKWIPKPKYSKPFNKNQYNKYKK